MEEKTWIKIKKEIEFFEENIEKKVVSELNKAKEKRQLKRNEIRKDLELKSGDYVLVRHRAQVQGVSRKLLTSFSNIPFKVIKVKKYGAFLSNIFDDTVVLRAKNELKLIKTTDPKTLNVPDEIVSLLGQVTAENILQWFEDLNVDEFVGIQTRSKRGPPDTKKRIIDLLADDDDSDEENTEKKPEKRVRFDL